MRTFLTAFVLSICLLVYAPLGYAGIELGEVIEKLPPLKQGIAWDLIENKAQVLSTTEVATIKDKFAIEVGYIGGNDDTHGLALALSVDLLKVKDVIDIPILDLIEIRPCVYVSASSINSHRIMESEVSYGVGATLIEAKF